jgi:hypothetical protein
VLRVVGLSVGAEEIDENGFYLDGNDYFEF